MSGNRYGSSVVNDVDRKLDVPVEKTDSMRKIMSALKGDHALL